MKKIRNLILVLLCAVAQGTWAQKIEKPTDLTCTLTPGDGTVATLSWTENGSATDWIVAYKKSIDEDFTEVNVTDNPYTLTGLTPETSYTAKVRVYNGTDYSDWSNVITFTPTNAHTLTVNDGTNTNSYVPVYGTWCDAYLKCEFIIPAAQLNEMENSIISRMSFYLSSSAEAAWTGTFRVFLKEVDETTLSAYLGLDNATVVYEGTLDATGSTMDIAFQNDFSYDDGNLLVGVYQIVKGNYKGASFYGINATGASIYGYNSSNIESISATQQNFLPKTTFTYTAGPAPAVEKPTNLVVSNLTDKQATISWTSAEDAWNLRYKETDAADWTVVENLTTKTYNLENLMANTTYNVQVQAVKGNETSKWSKVTSFTTGNGIPYRPAFTSGLPTGWKHFSGKLSDVQAGTETLTEVKLGGENTWYVSGSKAYISLSGIKAKHWLVTPAVTLGQASNLSFDLWMTGYYSSYDPSDTGTDDKFVVLVSDDDGATWTAIATWDNAGSERVLNDLTKTASSFTLNFPAAYADKTVKVAFYAESSISNATNYLYLNNVVFDDANRCIEPTDLTSANVTNHAATLSWTSEGDRFNLQYKTGDGEWTSVNGINAKSYNLTGLTPTTTYTFRVQTVCSSTEQSIWSEEATFTTMFGIPFTENFASGSRPTGWTSYSGLMSEVLTGATNLTESAGAWAFNSYNNEYYAYTNLTSQYAKQWLVTPDIIVDVANSQLTFDLKLYAQDQLGTDDQFAVLVSTNEGTTWSQLALWNNTTARTLNSISNEGEQMAINLSAYEGKTIRLAFYAESTVANTTDNDTKSIRISNVLVDATPAADTHRPQSLAVSSMTNNSATVTWAADDAVTGWNAQYRKRNAVVWYDATVTGNSCSFTVSAGNCYEVRVQAVTADGTSGWSTVIFDTNLPEGDCSISYKFKSTDQTSGWNGSAVKVVDTTTGIVVASLTLGAGKAEETGYLPLCNGRKYKFVWAPTEDYEGQASYYFYDVNGDEIFYKDEELRLSYSKLKEYTMDCTAVTCHQPTDLKATEVGFYSATVSWEPGDEDQTSWEIWYSGYTDTPPASPTVTTVTTTTYTFENLYSDYTYYIYVRGVKGEEKSKWSRLLQIRTKNAKALPTDLIAGATGYDTAEISWTVNGAETKWNLLYGPDGGTVSYVYGLTTNGYTLTGLTPNTHYYMQVQAVYDNNSVSNWTPSPMADFWTADDKALPENVEADNVEFTTADITWVAYGAETKWNVRYQRRVTEDFEFGLPTLCTLIDNDGDGKNWYLSDDEESYCHSGNYCMVSASYKSGQNLTPDNWLITPQFQLGGSVKFWARGQDPNDYKEHFAVYLSTTGNTVDDFTTVVLDETVATSTYTQYAIDLSEYSGKGYVAIRHFNCSGQFRLNIDDVTILEPNETDEWTVIEGLTEAKCSLTGLTQGTVYEVQVQAVYDDESTSDWTESCVFETLNLGTVALADDDSQSETKNAEIIETLAGMGVPVNIGLAGRTLYKDGDWNTICLPFDLSADQIANSDLAGADIRALSTASFSDAGVLTLNFTPAAPAEGAVTAITAGTPYIIKWTAANDYVDDNDHNVWQPVFQNVTVDKTTRNKECDLGGNKKITFKGTYTKLGYIADTPRILFLGGANTLYYPKANASIGAQRAYFELSGLTASENTNLVRAFVLNFGNETTGIRSIENGKWKMENEADAWYGLDGRKLSSKPTRKGLYIHNGKAVVIK